jgi:hypothetical protein
MKNMDDIFDKLKDNLSPSINQLKELQKHLEQTIQRRIIDDLHNFRTIVELDRILDVEEVWFIEWPELLTHYESALNRIRGVILAYKEIHGLEMLN